MVILRGEFVHTLQFTPICNQFIPIYQIGERPYLDWGENEWAAILIGEKIIITWGENDWGENEWAAILIGEKMIITWGGNDWEKMIGLNEMHFILSQNVIFVLHTISPGIVRGVPIIFSPIIFSPGYNHFLPELIHFIPNLDMASPQSAKWGKLITNGGKLLGMYKL